MFPATRPLLRAVLLAVATALTTVLITALVPPPASAAPTLIPGTRAFGLKVLSTASAYEGRPYRYGATGPYSFDCSGYTRFVIRKATGRTMPRTARAQYAAAKHIRKSSIRPGDLVFFHRGGYVYHAAIYAGSGRIWHSPYGGRGVTRAKIWTSSWRAGRLA
jgi:cell wall-associated NlpC family hydrolase